MRRFLLAAVMCGAVYGRASGRHAGSADPARQLHRRPEHVAGQLAGLLRRRPGRLRLVRHENFSGSTSEHARGTARSIPSIQEMQVSQWNLGCGKQSSRIVRLTAALPATTAQWDDVVVGLEANYMHGKFGGTSTASQELVSGAALSDSYLHTTCTSTRRRRSRFRTWQRSALAPAMPGAASCPMCSAAFALGKADIIAVRHASTDVGQPDASPASRTPLADHRARRMPSTTI